MKHEITISEAEALLKKYINSGHLLKHSRETEIIMRFLARYFGEDEELWAATGLLHDLDFDSIGECIEKHGQMTCEILEKEGYDIAEMFHAIKAHCEELGHLGIKRESRLDFCLAAAENTTGIIVAYVLMRPDKKIANAEASSVVKKLKDKAFAAKVNRQLIYDIEKTGLERKQFIEICLNAMKTIADEIGL